MLSRTSTASAATLWNEVSPWIANRGADAKKSMNQPLPSERRQAVRFPCRMEVVCRIVAPVKSRLWQGAARDLSVEGIGLVFFNRCDPGTLLEVEMISPDGLTRSVRLVLLKHQQPEADDSWSLGGVFYSNLSFEEFQALRAEARQSQSLPRQESA